MRERALVRGWGVLLASGTKPPDPHCYFELDSTSLCSPTKVVCSLSEISRHISVLAETIKKGIHDADSEARIEARK